MKKGLPPGWRISEEYQDAKQAEYVKKMVKEIQATPRTKISAPTHFKGIPVKELTPAQWEEFNFSLQPKSTQDALVAQKTRKPEEDIDHLLRPMPECIAKPEASSLTELVGERIAPYSYFEADERRRRSQKNTIGQSEAGSVDLEKRQKGIEAFTYSKPAELTDAQVKRLTKLEEIVNTPLEPEPAQKQPWWKRIWNNPDTGRRLTKEEFDDFMGRK